MRAIAIKAATIMTTLAAGAATAAADDNMYYPSSVNDYGVSMTLGGGVQDFTSSRMRDTTNTGGMWDVRAMFGHRFYFGGEAAYTGSAQTISPVFGGKSDGTLIGTGLEADVRFNALPLSVVTPYAFLGLGWRRYDVTGETFTRSDTGINDQDDQLEVPFGGGIQYMKNGFLADARFTYRVATYEDLVVQQSARDTTSDAASMDTWAVGAHVGYEF
jgi:hypothetical protein